jgi:hypothetical protein
MEEHIKSKLSYGAKYAISIFAGIVTSALVVIIAVAVCATLHWQVQSFFFFFFVPVGSCAIGILSALGFTFSAKYLDMKIKKTDYPVIILLALLTAFMIYFTQYGITAVDSQGKLIYSFSEGTHISDFVLKDTNQRINFSNFMKFDISHRQFSIISYNHYTKFNRVIIDSTMMGWLSFFLEILGYIGGAVVGAQMVLTKYCDICQKYYKDKKTFNFNVNQAEQVIDKIDESIKNKNDIYKALESLDGIPGPLKLHFKGEKCPTCGKGVLTAKMTAGNVHLDVDASEKTLLELNTINHRVVDFHLDRDRLLEKITTFVTKTDIELEDD